MDDSFAGSPSGNPFAPSTFGISGKATSLFEEMLGQAHPLFSREDFPQVLQARTEDMIQEIERYGINKLLNTGTQHLLSYFYDRYAIELPRLDEQDSSICYEEVEFRIMDPSPDQPETVLGTCYKIRVPFSGDVRVFNSRPSNINVPQAPIAHLEEFALTFTYDQIDHDADALAAHHELNIATVEEYLGWLANDAEDFNSQIIPRAAAEIQARRTKLLNDQRVAASLGIRLERAGLPLTYAAPQIQRKPRIAQPKASAEPYVPEPALEMAEYEHILGVIRATSLVIERNPTTFARSTEPQIRDHFLVQLNGHYEGQATGETFNAYGKTDILVRSGEKNIFIAEVKFWNGPKSITDGLVQLLTRYATWRDSKVALIVLNRRRNFSAVLDQVPGAIEAYENVLRRLEIPSQTDFRYLLQHPDDPNKELLLTVMCLEVPRRERTL